jgi:hypothetical protein
MRKRGHHTKPDAQADHATGARPVYVRIAVDTDDARDFERLAKRLGVSVDTLLNKGMALAMMELTGELPDAKTVEWFAKRRMSILRKQDLN